MLKVKILCGLADNPCLAKLAFDLANYLASSRFVVFVKVVASSVPVAVYSKLFRVSCLCFV